MFLFAEVGAMHGRGRVVEIADELVGEKIAGLNEAEVHRPASEVVEHHHVGVGT